MVLAMEWEAEREREAQRQMERALLEKERAALLSSEISSEVSEHIYTSSVSSVSQHQHFSVLHLHLLVRTVPVPAFSVLLGFRVEGFGFRHIKQRPPLAERRASSLTGKRRAAPEIVKEGGCEKEGGRRERGRKAA
jgi:hypothetical protein